MSRRRSAAGLLLVLAVACGVRPTTIERTPVAGAILVPTDFGSSRVELTIQPSYVLGSPARIDVTLVATRGTLRGPVEARVMASGINEGGSPAEVLVRRLAATPVMATAAQRATTSVTWSGDDEFGARVPADDYVLLLEFELADGGAVRTVRATATLQMND
ncbi:MAG TPA: hypothetical protein VGQ86_01280 [Candidatus Limnocylindria bacterium]|nr:hypothetical protein [Candidatus Limnocylindria bacterium]